MRSFTVLSLQSGTSADGIDVAIVSFTPTQGMNRLVARPLFVQTYPFAAELRTQILEFTAGASFDAGQVCRLNTELGQAFAAAAQQAVAGADYAVDLAVSHGQTFYHWVADGQVRGSLQLGEAAWIAEAVGCPVISNVRAADIAGGGQGAPLMAVFDQLWLNTAAAQHNQPLATVNIGGISNIQIVYPDGQVVGFDAGPGNALLDEVAQQLLGLPYDPGGSHARKGEVHRLLLASLQAHPYPSLHIYR